MSNKLYLARRARINKLGEVTEVCGDWCFMVSGIVDDENREGEIRVKGTPTKPSKVQEFLGYEIHPESDKFVNAPSGTVAVDANGEYRLLAIGAEGKVFDDEELANRISEENKLIEEEFPKKPRSK